MVSEHHDHGGVVGTVTSCLTKVIGSNPDLRSFLVCMPIGLFGEHKLPLDMSLSVKRVCPVVDC